MTALSIFLGILVYNIVTVLSASIFGTIINILNLSIGTVFSSLVVSVLMFLSAWVVQAMIKKLCSKHGNAVAALKVVGAFIILMACSQFLDSVNIATIAYLLSGVYLWYIARK